jgi:predicted ribosomally synthesized peptide with nif11-like leader
MSVENLKKYGKLCAEDDEVRKHAKEIGIKDLDGQIAYGKSLGLEFSSEDFEALAREAGIDGENELSEEDLKKVAGGFITLSLVSVAAMASVAALAVGGAAVAGAGVAALVNKPKW